MTKRSQVLGGAASGAGFVLVFGVVSLTCSSAPTGHGPSKGSGGRAQDAGATGGQSSSGGAVGTGGTSNSGGAPGSGGVMGGGGGSGGGASGSGGAASSSGGTSGSGGNAVGSGGTTASGGRAQDGGIASGGADAGTGGGGGGGGSVIADGGVPNVNDVDVYLIGGQSNATGQGYTKNIPSSFVINTQVQLYHSSGINSGAAANSWITLRPASEGADSCNLGLRFGPELAFGNTIQSFYPARSIYLIKHATSNTGLAVDWAPGSNATDTSRFGAQFKTFVSTVDGGLKALQSKGLNPIIRGMLWQQGERDVDMAGSAASNYGKSLSAFIARVREQWSAPNMLFVYGYVYPASNYGSARDQVRQGQADVDQDSGAPLAVKGAFVISGDPFSLRANDPGTCLPNDKIHFGSQGQLDLGKLMATKVHDKLRLP